MKHLLSTSFQAALCSTLAGLFLDLPASAQTLDNGDLSRGNAVWRGDRKVDIDPADPANKVLAVELKKDKSQSFSQQIDTGGAPGLTVTFDVKTTADYKGGGIRLRMTRPDGKYVFRNLEVVSGTEWKPISWNYDDVQGARRVTFEVEVRAGTGQLFFDNFVLKGK